MRRRGLLDTCHRLIHTRPSWYYTTLGVVIVGGWGVGMGNRDFDGLKTVQAFNLRLIKQPIYSDFLLHLQHDHYNNMWVQA